MGAVTVNLTGLPPTGRWTVDHLDALADDGLRYELADGVLLVTPSPTPRHQQAVLSVAVLLRQRCPAEMQVYVAPLDFRPTRQRSVQPDVLVVLRNDVGAESLTGTPLLVVEVLSPGTRLHDLTVKRALYAESGVPNYWLLDPEGPSLTVLRLHDGVYAEAGMVSGSTEIAVTSPFPVTVQPSSLIDG